MICPECQQSTSAETGYLLCRHCGTSLYDDLMQRVPTKRLEGNRNHYHKMPLPPSSNPLLIYIDDDGVPMSVDRQGQIVIGRSDPNNVYHTIDVDLVAYQAHQQGVSRRHAILDAAHDVPMLTDLNSYNGTYVNGERIAPNHPVGLRSGDTVRFGRLAARVYFK